ncbi:MAG TPA: hypothetical protein VFB80_04530 [Pirellulaceae bacterium]|nr:hypothetical protein [Pirellulaceae bacterium]
MFTSIRRHAAAVAILLTAACPLAAEEWPADTIDLSAVTVEQPANASIWLLGGQMPAGEEAPLVPIGGEHPPYPTFPPCWCKEWKPWYVGVEGGWTIPLNVTPDSNGVGAFFDGVAFGTQLHGGENFTLRLGLRLSPRWRADVSYTNIHGDYQWRTAFFGGAQIAGFDSDATSNIVLGNAYWHFFPPAEHCNRPRFDPYTGVGLGVAFNTLAATAEFPDGNPAGQYATVFGDTTACLATRFALGTHFWIWPNLAMDMSFAVLYVGDFQTDDFRTTGGIVQPIGRYDFHNNWLGTFQLGFVWFPQPGFYRR